MSVTTPDSPIFLLGVNNDFMIALSGHYAINIVVFEGCRQKVTGVNNSFIALNLQKIWRNKRFFKFGLKSVIKKLRIGDFILAPEEIEFEQFFRIIF